MKKILPLIGIALLFLASCDTEIHNIALDPNLPPVQDTTFTPAEVNPVNINEQGFEFLEKMQGQWIGPNTVMNETYDWFTFDYRAISQSHIFGMFEGGSMGNLFTSFFVTDFDGTRTLMARNGGLLNGIYRTSYFVLDSVRVDADESFYRFVDGVNGTSVMHMELTFRNNNDSLYFYAYTSRLGMNTPPTRHMTFEASKYYTELSDAAAQTHNFPQNTPAWDFSAGWGEWLYVEEGQTDPMSATYLAMGTQDVFGLAPLSGDPFTISDHPYVSTLTINAERNPAIEDTRLFMYLSYDPLTDGSGYMDINNFNSVILFPDIIPTEDSFQLTYVHPGDYYVTVIADVNGDYFPSSGDITHVSQPISITPEGNFEIDITDITVQN